MTLKDKFCLFVLALFVGFEGIIEFILFLVVAWAIFLFLSYLRYGVNWRF